MIKRYKRKNSRFMRRASRIYPSVLNKGKTTLLSDFLLLYAKVVRYYIEMLWSTKEFSSILSPKGITDKAVSKFGITARLSQLAAKQAKEIVNSQRRKSKRKQHLPLFRNITVNIDSRFFTITKFSGSFDWALKFNSGIPPIIVPFNNTNHALKFLTSDWILGNSIRLGIDKRNTRVPISYFSPTRILF